MFVLHRPTSIIPTRIIPNPQLKAIFSDIKPHSTTSTHTANYASGKSYCAFLSTTPQIQELRPIVDTLAVIEKMMKTSGSRQQARSVFTKEQRDILEDLIRKKRLTNGTEHRTLRLQQSMAGVTLKSKGLLNAISRKCRGMRRFAATSSADHSNAAPRRITGSASTSGLPVAAARENRRQDVNVGHQRGEDDTEDNNTLPVTLLLKQTDSDFLDIGNQLQDAHTSLAAASREEQALLPATQDQNLPLANKSPVSNPSPSILTHFYPPCLPSQAPCPVHTQTTLHS
ncbi:hypothetical protein BC829DRAFT_450481 [Chytridium lagenaria]|nr:hypothetical protein BC829DRAFT_450481 [Chytridium lagenaria]